MRDAPPNLGVVTLWADRYLEILRGAPPPLQARYISNIKIMRHTEQLLQLTKEKNVYLLIIT